MSLGEDDVIEGSVRTDLPGFFSPFFREEIVFIRGSRDFSRVATGFRKKKASEHSI